MSKEDQIIAWLLKGDVSIQYRVHRDLLRSSAVKQRNLQKRIETEGGALDCLPSKMTTAIGV